MQTVLAEFRNRQDGNQFQIIEDIDGSIKFRVVNAYGTLVSDGVTAVTSPVTGGISVSAGGVTLPIFGAGLNGAALGDSITARNYMLATAGIDQATYGSKGYLTVAQLLTNKKVNILGISGHPGAAVTTSMNGWNPLGDYIATDIAPYASQLDFVVFLGGINDISNAAATDVTLIAALRSKIFAPLMALGIKNVIIGTLTPYNSLTAQQQSYVVRVNDFIRSECAKYGQLKCVDFAQPVTDPQTGLYKSGFSADNLHPDPRAAIAMATPLAKILDSLVPAAAETTMSGSPYDTLSFSCNPLALGANASGTNKWALSGAGATGTGPASWSGVAKGTATVAFTGSQAYPAAISYPYNGTGLGFSFTAVAGNDSMMVYPGPLNGSFGDVQLNKAWAATTAFTFGQLVTPGNGYMYKAISYPTGTTGGSAPTWPTSIGQTVVDGTVTWLCMETVSAGDLVRLEADLVFTSTTGRLIANLDMAHVDAAFGALIPSTMNFGTFNAMGANTLQCPQYSAGGAQWDAAAPQYLPLNKVIRLTSPVIQLPTNIAHLEPAVRIFGEAGATAAGQILRIELKKLKTW